MAICKPAFFAGIGECKALMDKMVGGVLYAKGTTFSGTTILSEDTRHSALASLTEATALALPIMSFENTSDDISITTTQLGKKIADGKPIPSGVIYLDSSLCDYKTIKELEGTSFDFEPYFQDGSAWTSMKSDGTYKPFRVRIATKFGLPPEDKTQSYPVYLFFDNYAEFEDVAVIQPDFTFNDLIDYVPAGLSMSIVTAYTAGDVVVKVTKRCSNEPMTGLVAGDFLVRESAGKPIVGVSTLVEDGQGQYTLTIKTDTAGTPASLASGEYALIQAQDDDSTYTTHISNTLKVTG